MPRCSLYSPAMKPNAVTPIRLIKSQLMQNVRKWHLILAASRITKHRHLMGSMAQELL